MSEARDPEKPAANTEYIVPEGIVDCSPAVKLVYVVIDRGDGLSQREVAKRAGMPARVVRDVQQELLDRNVVEDRIDPDARRCRLVTVEETPDGVDAE